MRWVALMLALAVHLAGLAIDHIDTWAKPDWVFDLVIFAPIAVVIAAARLWPSWWLLPLVFVFFFFVPIGVDELERQLSWYPVGVNGPGYHEQSGMDSLTTSFLAWEAFPAVVIAAIAVPVARYWAHGPR